MIMPNPIMTKLALPWLNIAIPAIFGFIFIFLIMSLIVIPIIIKIMEFNKSNNNRMFGVVNGI